MTRFWLVRHGPTHAKSMIGWTDLPADLSDQSAIARLNAYLPPAAPVISSDLRRAVATADCLAPRRRLAHDPGLREIHFGLWEDQTHDALAADPNHAGALQAFWQKPGPSRAPNGECWDEMQARVLASLDRLTGLAPDVIVVCHFGAILAALQYGLNTTPADVFQYRIENLSVSRLIFTKPPKVETISHIP